MDITKISKKTQEIIHKYKYVIIVIAVGFILLLIPGKSKSGRTSSVAKTSIVQENTVNDELSELLSHVKGAGKVKVYLTISSGAETVYQTNEDYSSTDAGLTQRSETVTHTNAERNEEGMIKQINPPTYQGAIIICQGADNPAVKLALINAVAKVTGLGTDKISVLKMK